MVSRAGLLLLDEIHLLNDPGRGPTLEAVVARMRTLSQSEEVRGTPIAALRTVSLSATIRSMLTTRPPPRAQRLLKVPLASRDDWTLAGRRLDHWLSSHYPESESSPPPKLPMPLCVCPSRISNHEDIARWLDSGCVVKAFDETYRPVPLQRSGMVGREALAAAESVAQGSRRPHAARTATLWAPDQAALLGPRGAANDAGETAFDHPGGECSPTR